MASPLPGRVSLTVSTPSGQSCTIAALASGRVDQLHVAIERALKIPRVVQRLICEGREIYSKDCLAELRLEDGSIITVVNSWPQKPEEIVEKLKLAESTTATHALAAAVAQCLEHEDSSVKVAALSQLSWMGRVAAPHAAAIAKILQNEERGIRAAAAEALSWLEEAGAAYAADILAFTCLPLGRFGHVSIMSRAKKAIAAFFMSELPSTRLTAMKSIIGLLEDKDNPATPPEELQRNRFSLPLICEAFFDPSADIRKTAASFLVSRIPVFSAEDGSQPVPVFRDELILQFLSFGERINLEAELAEDAGIVEACRDIARKLDASWPKWAGWQEGLDDPDSSVEAATCEVSVSMVQFLRRRFCEWQHLQTQDGRPARFQLEAVFDLLHPMVEDGLRSRKWQVRQAAVESLISLEPFGVNVLVALILAQQKEKEKQVLETMARFFAKYGCDYENNQQLFYYFDHFDCWCSDESDGDYVEYLEEEEEWQLRDKNGGYSKSHLSRSARHNKKHGADSSRDPGTDARQKRWQRLTKPEETQNFAESKRKSSRDKERDRRLKSAMLGQELSKFAMDHA